VNSKNWLIAKKIIRSWLTKSALAFEDCGGNVIGFVCDLG
jgi:hypothetical protein